MLYMLFLAGESQVLNSIKSAIQEYVPLKYISLKLNR